MRTFDESLYLTDLNIDASRAYYGVRKGHIARVVNGVYVSTSLGPDERRDVLRRNAARIATRTFANSVLAGSSAFHRGEVAGHVLLATPWGGKPVDVGGAFSIYFTRSQLDVGMNREVEHVSIEDDFGPYTVKRMSDDMLIIKNFQRQKGRPDATYLNVTDLAEVVERSMRVLGGREQLTHRLAGLVRHHGLSVYEESINAFVERVGSYTQSARPLTAFKVYWHKSQVATLSHDGHIWSFDYEPKVNLLLSVGERVGKRSPPSFLGSILPEMGPQADATMEDRLDGFRKGSRYISNITVHQVGASGAQDIITDVLAGELAKFKTNKLEFAGHIDRRFLSTAADDVLLGQMQEDPNMPRISGMQFKLAAHLDERGQLSAAVGKSFTHILKVPAGHPAYSTLGSMEWYTLTIAKMCGMNTEEFALVDLGHRGPGLLAERFDVRKDLNDTRSILTEDFWSVAGMTENNQKYKGELMDVADAVAKHSTDLPTDGRHLMAQAIFSWLCWNGDMHLKNLLLVKETRDTRAGFESIRLSPAYDIVCTQVYPGDAKTSAIALCGNRNHTLTGFRTLGKKLGIAPAEVDAMVDFLAASIPLWARKVASNLPACIKAHEPSAAHIERAQALFDVRCMMMIAELDGAKRKRSTQTAGVEAEGDVRVFSGEPMSDVAEHVEAERRRSWVPPAASAAASMAASRTRP